MRKLETILKWYIIGVSIAFFLLVMFILAQSLMGTYKPFGSQAVVEFLLVFGAFAGLVSYASYSRGR
jgi:hypothetical protein